MQRWNARSGDEISNDIKVLEYVRKIVPSSDGETMACGSEFDDYVQKWEIKNGEPIGEPINWSEGRHIRDEIERARLSGDQVCDAVFRKDRFPIQISRRAVCPYKSKAVLGRDNGIDAVCE